MKKIMIKKPAPKNILAIAAGLAGIFYVSYASTDSISIGLIWTAIASLAGALGIVAMKVFNVTY